MILIFKEENKKLGTIFFVISVYFLPVDFTLSWENVHDFLRLGHLPGLILPGQPHPGCGGHGLRGAEPGDHCWGLAEGEGVSDGHGAPPERAKSRFHGSKSGTFEDLVSTAYLPTLCVFSWQWRDKRRRRTRFCLRSFLRFTWRQEAYVAAAAEEEDPTGRCLRKQQRKLQRTSLTPWMSQLYLTPDNSSPPLVALLPSWSLSCVSAASSVPPPSTPFAGHALVSSSQHAPRKPDQHLQLFPNSPKLGGRLWGRRVQRSWGCLQESSEFHGDALEEENGECAESLLPNIQSQPQRERQAQHLSGPEWSHHPGRAHTHVHSCSQHGAGQGRHGEWYLLLNTHTHWA